MNTDTQVLDSAVAEPMVIEPITATHAPTEPLDQAVSTTIDPITGSNSNPGSSSNPATGNQVAVNTIFDYSVPNNQV